MPYRCPPQAQVYAILIQPHEWLAVLWLLGWAALVGFAITTRNRDARWAGVVLVAGVIWQLVVFVAMCLAAGIAP